MAWKAASFSLIVQNLTMTHLGPAALMGPRHVTWEWLAAMLDLANEPNQGASSVLASEAGTMAAAPLLILMS